MDPRKAPLRTGKLTLTTSLTINAHAVNDLFVSPKQEWLQGGSSPRPGSEFNIVQVNAEKGELFALYPTDYPAILHNRVPEAEWKEIVLAINERWSVLLCEHKRLFSGSLLSYTVLAIPVHLRKEHKFRQLEKQVLKDIGEFLDQVNAKLAAARVAILFFKEEGEADLPLAYFIEIRRE